MAKLSSRKAAFRRKKGFSLAVVILISFVGLVIIGAVLQFAVSSSGGGRVNTAMAEKYNLLQNALEEGKVLLKKSMNNENPPPKYTDKKGISPDTYIEHPDTLLLSGDLGATSKEIDLERIGIFGERGVLTVKIYDMQYEPKFVSEDVVDLQSMPPSMLLTANIKQETGGYEEARLAHNGTNLESSGGSTGRPDNMGIYLIRAELSVYNKKADENPIHTWSVETSVIQANSKTNNKE